MSPKISTINDITCFLLGFLCILFLSENEILLYAPDVVYFLYFL